MGATAHTGRRCPRLPLAALAAVTQGPERGDNKRRGGTTTASARSKAAEAATPRREAGMTAGICARQGWQRQRPGREDRLDGTTAATKRGARRGSMEKGVGGGNGSDASDGGSGEPPHCAATEREDRHGRSASPTPAVGRPPRAEGGDGGTPQGRGGSGDSAARTKKQAATQDGDDATPAW